MIPQTYPFALARFLLPMKGPDPGQPGIAAPAAPGGARVLLAVGPGSEAQSLHAALQAAGYGVTAAREIPGARTAAAAGDFDLILLDGALPHGRGGGWQWLAELRWAGVSAPVVALATGGAEERALALTLGADDCLSRPFDVRELLARVRALLRRAWPSPGGRRLRVADLEIDLQARLVQRDGRSLPLTPREFALLSYLIEHPGQVVTTEVLQEHLYGGERPRTPNAVASLVRQLRTKVGKRGTACLIQTVWGRGYLLRAEAQLGLANRDTGGGK
jgi:DNA-binding response OmpR family regulator